MEFQDHHFLHIKDKWFMWERAWESYRPITSVYWDGNQFVIDDKPYCNDPTDPYYGYGSKEMKDFCQKIEKRESRVVQTPEIGPLVWFRDRKVSLGPCAPRDVASWKRMCRGKHRTCRKFDLTTRNKFTRRNLRT